jgi:uncharacterized repeat protein (TIGR02543 family)
MDGTASIGGLMPVSYTIENAVALPVPVKNGYDFIGWYDNVATTGQVQTSITSGTIGNKTFYAKWKGTTYTLSLSDGAGSVHVQYGEAITTLPVPVKDGYDFVKWIDRNDNNKEYRNGDVFNKAGDATLTAVWAAKIYTLTLSAGEGTVIPNTWPVGYNAEVGQLPEAEREGFNFIGWYTGEEGSGTQYTAGAIYNETGNLTLYAYWEEIYSTEIENIVTNDIHYSMAPNPAAEYFVVSSKNKIKYIEVLDISGKVLLRQYEDPKVFVTTLKKGIYIVKICLDDRGLAVDKLIISGNSEF